MLELIHPKDKELTSDDLSNYLTRYKSELLRYKMLMSMYRGEHDILTQDEKPNNKPDNRLVVNFSKYIVDTLNGYFIGNPIKTAHEDATISDTMKEIAKRNNQNDNNAELSKLCSIYGHAFEYLYQDEDANTRVTYLSPEQAFVIYDDTIAQEILYGVYPMIDENGKDCGYIYTDYGKHYYYSDKNSNLIIEEEYEEHYFGDVPIIEYVENSERQATFENVITLINAYDKAVSEKANDVDYFADAYLAVLGIELDDETLQNIRDNRVINLKSYDPGGQNVFFLDKPNADNTQENLIDRLERLIYQISMVSNINDESFGASSGIALQYKLQSMENLSLMKERKFQAGMMKRFKMIFNIPTNFPNAKKDEYLNIDYSFTRNIPANVLEEAQAAQMLTGIVSDYTKLGLLSIVDNIQDELERIEEDTSKSGIDAFSIFKDMNRPIVPQEEV